MNKCRSFLLLLIPIVLVSCVHPKALVYKDVENLQVRLIKQPPITVYVRFYNPNQYPLRFKDGMVTVAVDEIAVGTMTVDTSFTAAPLETFSVPLELHADLRKVLPGASHLIFKDSVFIKLHGYIRAGEKKGAMLKVPIHYEGYQHLESAQRILMEGDKRK